MDAAIEVPQTTPARRSRARARPSLSCPRCGLVLRERPEWINPVDCPRCLAYADKRIRLVARAGPPAGVSEPG